MIYTLLIFIVAEIVLLLWLWLLLLLYCTGVYQNALKWIQNKLLLISLLLFVHCKNTFKQKSMSDQTKSNTKMTLPPFEFPWISLYCICMRLYYVCFFSVSTYVCMRVCVSSWLKTINNKSVLYYYNKYAHFKWVNIVGKIPGMEIWNLYLCVVL